MSPPEVVAVAAGDARVARAALADAWPDAPSAELRRAFAEERVRRGGAAVAAEAPVAPGDRLEVLGEVRRIAPRALAGLSLLARGGDVAIVAKPAGVATQPERGADPVADRLRAGLLALLRGPGGELIRPRIAHRLDRETSGALAVALTRDALRRLSEAFAAREVRKEYLALVLGRPVEAGGVVDAALTPGAGRRARTIVARDGKPARTRWEVAEAFGRFALVRAWPETGRQHQVRAHLAHLGHPIVGDLLYGGQPLLLSAFKRSYRPSARGERPLIERVALHAAALAVPDVAGQPLAAEAPLPKDLRAGLAQLRRHGPRG